MQSFSFQATIDIIGINPFVYVPDNILQKIFKQSGKNTGPIRIQGLLNNVPFEQTLVKYSSHWRLYINTKMLKNSPKRIGEKVSLSIQYNPTPKNKPLHKGFLRSLEKDKSAQAVFNQLSPSLQNEIAGYISRLKTEEAVNRNIVKALRFLNGKGPFIGRTKL